MAHLSGGQHQRVLIARALAGEPELLSWTSRWPASTWPARSRLAETLRDRVAGGATVVLVLHELGPLEPLIDRAVVLRDGWIVYDGRRRRRRPARAARPRPRAPARHDHVPIRTGC